MMHDEVSDTENIRKNLAIERMIVEGCDILLDTSQTFVRQGTRAGAVFREAHLCSASYSGCIPIVTHLLDTRYALWPRSNSDKFKVIHNGCIPIVATKVALNHA